MAHFLCLVGSSRVAALRNFRFFYDFFVRLLWGSLDSSPCLRRASCGAVRLTHVDFSGTRADLLSWGPFRLLGVLVYLVLVTRILLFEDREAA